MSRFGAFLIIVAFLMGFLASCSVNKVSVCQKHLIISQQVGETIERVQTCQEWR